MRSRQRQATDVRDETIERVLRVSRKGFFYAGVISLFSAALQLAVPLYMLQVYDRVLGTNNLHTLLALTILVVGCLVVYGILDALLSELLSAVGHAAASSVALDALEEALAGTGRNGGQASQTLRDVAELRNFFSSPAVATPFEALLSPVLIMVMFMLHPAYGVTALAGAAVMVGLSVLARSASARPSAEANEEIIRTAAELDAASRASEVIVGMGMMANLAGRWRGSKQRYLAYVNLANTRSKRVLAMAKAVRQGLQVAILAVGAVLIVDRLASPGSMFAASLIMSRALAPFERLIESWRAWMSAREAFQRLRDLLENAPRRRMDGIVQPVGRLAVDRLTYAPPGAPRPAVRSVSFEVRPGEAVGVIGPSASGKTTLARLIVGVLSPSHGGVFLDGQNVWHWDRADFGLHVGYLPQSVGLLEGTVAENIARFGYMDRQQVIAAARRSGAHEMIGRLPNGYDTPIGEGGGFLSGGQRQQIALARALYGEPRLLVLDEPNAHLDQAGESALVNAIQHAKEWGAAVIVVAHKPAVLANADRVVVMRDGMVEKIGPRADIFAQFAVHPRLRQRVEANAGQAAVRSMGTRPVVHGPIGHPPGSPPHGSSGRTAGDV